MHAYNVLLAASPPGAAVELISRLLASGLRPDRYSIPGVPLAAKYQPPST